MAKYRVKAPDGSTLEFDGPDNASDAEVMQYAQSQYAAGETTLPKTEAGLLNVGGDALKLGSNLATGLAAPVFGVGSAIRTGSMEGFNAGTEGFAEGTHMDYSKKDGWAAETEKKIQHLLEKITELGGEAAVKTSDAMKYLPGLPGLTARAISGNEPLVRTLGEAATNFIPFERGIAGLRSIGKGKPNIAAEARAMAARDMAPPKVEPTMAPPETPLPTLDEKVPHIQEPPAPTGETPLPVIDHPVDEWNGIKLNRDAQPPVEPQGLSIASADEPIPHQPGPLEKQLPLKTPEDTLADALLSKDLGDNWVDQMRDNTRTNELRGEMASVDFPLRQEVLDHPAIKEAINNFRMEAERLKDQPEALAKLQEEFAAGMKQLGIEKPSDAYGKGLYDSGKGTALPIEKTNRPPLPSEPGRGWTAIIDEQPLAIKGPAKRIGGWNKQSGAIDPKVFVEGFRKILGTKVATPDGLPRIMYHGTSKDVPYKNIKPTSRGAWFTARSDDASSYAIENDSQRMRYEGGKYVPVNTASRVLPVYLDIKNPKILTSAENQKFHNSAGGNYAKSQSQYIAQAKREGYDGLMSEDGEIAIAFNKEQIHSALSGPDHLGNTKFGKSQRGGLGDPEFRKFKNRLPENLKRYAGPMYKEYKKAMAEGPVETTPNANAMNAISKIDGLHE